MGVVAAAPRTVVGRVPALVGAAVACGGTAVACARRTLVLAAGVAHDRPDELVELGILVLGALVLAWLAGSAAVAAACLSARSAGRVWRGGEAWVHRFAPTVLRRTLVVVVAAGLGAASVTAASAADVPRPNGTAATVPGDAAPDLGWVVTVPAPRPTAAADGADAAGAGDARQPGAPSETLPAPDGGEGTVGTTRAPGVGTRAPDAWAPQTAAAGTPAPLVTTTPRAAGTATWAASAPAAASPGSGATQAPPGPATARDDPGEALSTPRTAPPAADEESHATVVVRPGDTLWGIAARHLPPGAGDDRIAAAWPAWYAANATTIGPDPGLIRPGQVLAVPDGSRR